MDSSVTKQSNDGDENTVTDGDESTGTEDNERDGDCQQTKYKVGGNFYLPTEAQDSYTMQPKHVKKKTIKKLEIEVKEMQNGLKVVKGLDQILTTWNLDDLSMGNKYCPQGFVYWLEKILCIH